MLVYKYGSKVWIFLLCILKFVSFYFAVFGILGTIATITLR